MKRLLLILIGWASISLASSPLWASPVTPTDLVGIWVAHLDVPGGRKMFEIQFIIKEDGKYNFRMNNVGEAMPAPCKGSYTFENGLFSGKLDCSAADGPSSMEQVIDFSHVSLEQLNSKEGFVIVIDYPLVGETYPFIVYRHTSPYL